MNRFRPLHSFCIVLALIIGSARLVAQAPSPAAQGGLPAKFQVYVDSQAGTGFNVAIEGDHLVYTTYKSSKRLNKVRKIQPTAAQWQAFWLEMDGADVWHWSAKYAPATAREGGIQWNLTLENGGQSIQSEGNNAYPSDADPAKNGPDDGNFTKRFIRFNNAVLHLLGETALD